MECSDKFNDIDERLKCMCLRCSSDDDMNHTLGTESVERKQVLLAVGLLFGMDPLNTIEGSLSVVRSNYGSGFSAGGSTGLKTDLSLTHFAGKTD